MRTITIQLTDRDYDLAMEVGNGSITVGICKILKRTKIKGKSPSLPETAKEQFIDKYLEHRNGSLPISAMVIYQEYLEYETDLPLGKGKFYNLLRSNGFNIVTGPSNVLRILNIKSNWL